MASDTPASDDSDVQHTWRCTFTPLHGLHVQDNEAPAMVQDQSHGMVTIIHRWPFTVSWLVNRPDTLKCTTNQ